MLVGDPLSDCTFTPDLPDAGVLILEYSARIEGDAARRVVVREALSAQELALGIHDRAGLTRDPDVIRNALAAFLASRAYRLSGRFFSRVADVVTRGPA